MKTLSDIVDDIYKNNNTGLTKVQITAIANNLITRVGDSLKNGLQGMSNNTLFVREGKFPSGRAGMADVAVYAVKSFQVRVYGGIIRIKGQSIFLCPEAVIKKKDRADQAQLERVAKVLGEHHER